MSEATNANPWGRVDETNAVFVKDGEGERKVGEFPDGTAAEALAYFTRKFDDLEGQVRILEQRLITGSASADITATVSKLETALEEPAAVGDLNSLRARVASLKDKAQEFSAAQEQARAEQKQLSIAQREEIIAEAEKIASQPEASIRWKDSAEQMEDLFKRWQEVQRKGPNIGKSQADELWKRFRQARNSFDTKKRRFFAQLDATNKSVKETKEALIARADELASKGSDGIPAYRSLLDEWKKAGRASKKIDDQLWARFKAAGDVLYSAKAQEQAVVDEEYEANLAKKQELLEKYRGILDISVIDEAREKLAALHEEWEKHGRVPRNQVRNIEDSLKSLEAHVQKLEDDHWQATNPETIARSEGLRGQLEDSLATLEASLEDAKSGNDKKRIADLEQQIQTQRSWLEAIS